MQNATPCKPWDGTTNEHGYGRVYVPGKGTQLAHRVTWAEVHGEIPPGVVIRHRCDNPPCTEITHLTDGTQADNVRDMHERGRAAVGPRNDGACRKGHIYDDRDWQTVRGRRVRWCRRCHREWHRARRLVKAGHTG